MILRLKDEVNALIIKMSELPGISDTRKHQQQFSHLPFHEKKNKIVMKILISIDPKDSAQTNFGPCYVYGQFSVISHVTYLIYEK